MGCTWLKKLVLVSREVFDASCLSRLNPWCTLSLKSSIGEIDEREKKHRRRGAYGGLILHILKKAKAEGPKQVSLISNK